MLAHFHMDNLNHISFTTIGAMATDGYFIYQCRQACFSYHNNVLTEILELTSAQLQNNPRIVMNRVHPADIEHAQSCYEECIEDQLSKKYEIRLLFGEREKYVRCTIFPVNNPDGLYLLGIIEDTTIDRHNKILIEQINARKNVALEVLSHDLKEPIGLVKLTASSIQASIEKTGDKRLVDSIDFITHMCERNMKLVRSIINHEFLRSSNIELNKERVDIVQELHDLIRTYRKSHLRELKNFKFESSADKIFMSLDTMKFTQVINNLISNALKFTIIDGVIAVAVQEQEATVLVTVSDNGIGIPDALKPVLFERGGQALRRGLSGEESRGLGMSIVKSIVDLHQGKIWFESTEGYGTAFYIELPK